jgi:hypothetical protein
MIRMIAICVGSACMILSIGSAHADQGAKPSARPSPGAVLTFSDVQSDVKPDSRPIEAHIHDAPIQDAHGQDAHGHDAHGTVSEHLSDAGGHLSDGEETEHYPDSVCYCPGHPQLPLWKRPGDINLKDCPPERYCLPNCVRAGQPHCIAPWAKCATNEKYSAWYVGGGTSWLLPRYIRCRRPEEGTWGLDYDGLLRPRRVWLNWSCDREQGGLGSYATDGAPKFLERFHHE